ncbi:MAG: NUDIX domain-containing protein [Leptolyngbyaceae cyanobacterium bins.59]|nr:NUDIX domain-containing protein [Leptolyngbyaceae cyanobacterium bins.59]
MSYSYKFPRPALTVDCVVFGFELSERDLKVLLIERKLPPFAGQWALPGGFVRVEESVEAAALRELREETGLDRVFLEQLYTFGEPDRDPRERVVTIAYYALVSLNESPIQAATDARDAAWFSIRQVPSLAFDHDRILAMALARLKGKVRYEPIGFELLPKKFTLTQLQKLYELILGVELDKRNFRKKLLQMEFLTKLDELETGVAHRAAYLYEFDEQKYRQLKEKGFNFEI